MGSRANLSHVLLPADGVANLDAATKQMVDAKQTSDADLTAIAGLAPSNDDLLQRKSGAWTNRTLAQVKTDLSLQPLDQDLTDIAALAPTNDDVLQRKSGAWANRTLAQLKTDLSLQPLDSDLTAIAALAPADDDFLQRKSGAWANRTLAQVRTDLALQPLDGDLTAIAAIAPANGDVIQRVAGAWTNQTMAQLRVSLNPPRALLRQTVASSLANNAFTSVTFDTEDRDTAAGHSTISNTSRYVFPVTGDYWVSGAVCFSSSAGFKAVRFALNGSAIAGSQVDATSVAGAQWPVEGRSRIVAVTANDYFEVQGFQDTGGALNTGVSADVQSTMCVLYIG